VILLRNLSERLANGSRGIVVGIHSSESSGPFAAFRTQTHRSSEAGKQLPQKEGVQVRFDNGDLVLVERAEFTQSGSPELLYALFAAGSGCTSQLSKCFCRPMPAFMHWVWWWWWWWWCRLCRRQAHALADTAQAGLGADGPPRAGHDAVARRADARGGVRVRAGLRGAQPRHRAARALDAIAVCHLFLCDA
jgi:hypothetical protein